MRAALVTPGVILTVAGVTLVVGALAALPVAWTLSRESVARALRSF